MVTCLSVVGLFFIIIILGSLVPDSHKKTSTSDSKESGASSSKPDYEIENGVAKKSLELSGHLKWQTEKAMRIFHQIATENPSVEKIEISCITRADNHRDQYGNLMKGDFVHDGKEYWSMGSLTFSKEMLDEIRKYKTAQRYIDNTVSKVQVYMMMKDLKYSEFLGDHK